MVAFNKITLIILAFALIAMYFKETNVQIMLLFFAYLSHYPNSEIGNVVKNSWCFSQK